MNTVKRTNDEWLGLVKQQRASGQSAKAWCKAENISYCRLSSKIDPFFIKLSLKIDPLE